MNVRSDQVGLMNDIKDRMMMKKKKEEEKKKKQKKKSGSWGGIYVVGVWGGMEKKKREGNRIPRNINMTV